MGSNVDKPTIVLVVAVAGLPVGRTGSATGYSGFAIDQAAEGTLAFLGSGRQFGLRVFLSEPVALAKQKA